MNILYTGADEGVNKIHRLKEQGWLELLERAAKNSARPAWYVRPLARLGDVLIASKTKLKHFSAPRHDALVTH
ncbi:MAG: hypothetical protein CO094_08790 [Anaerolineae bacterium CG_4_9_14_3_um_filter_57_17]|nr:hypothetical protein [bacterium]NCT19612.1 hypothetical protein [bacterium]OIO85845.1 MAG: hypothetical protein AUK01_04915 [Anaerolineae bacterium CG2_30_57_67]PJB65867.1 MAG: hypothetical protein CO094_08790 [Anaerolineae bacterium CG_4_9_14_3_um_filter_57_17]